MQFDLEKRKYLEFFVWSGWINVPTTVKCDNVRYLQGCIPLLGGARGGFLKETHVDKITNNVYRVDTTKSFSFFN
tara:strand:+ start:66 stop:290 length:225 start_codon:yes stop_codon:yes gene_type:complete